MKHVACWRMAALAKSKGPNLRCQSSSEDLLVEPLAQVRRAGRTKLRLLNGCNSFGDKYRGCRLLSYRYMDSRSWGNFSCCRGFRLARSDSAVGRMCRCYGNTL